MKVFKPILILLTLTNFLYSQNWEAGDVPNSRVLRHDDGSRTVYFRAKGNKKLLVKKNVGPGGEVRLVTRYFMDDHGNPRACKIYDSQNKLLFKVSYGYAVATGRLMKERMLFADKKDSKGNHIIASETRYTYDAQGNRSKPIVFTFVKGQTAEDLFGKKSTLPDKVYDDQRDIADPTIHKQ